jgi:signal peptidase I
MMITGLRVVAKCVQLAWLAVVVALIGLVALPHLLPFAGRQMYIVRGASMQPSISLGSVVLIDAVDPALVQPNDVITFRAPGGSVVTHRVVNVSTAGELSFTTKGDANESADPLAVPATSVIGRVERSIPGLGHLIAVLASGNGALWALGLLASLALTAWFAEELVATARPASVRRSAVRPSR